MMTMRMRLAIGSRRAGAVVRAAYRAVEGPPGAWPEIGALPGHAPSSMDRTVPIRQGAECRGPAHATLGME